VKANKYKSGQKLRMNEIMFAKVKVAFIWKSNLNIQSKKKTTEETTQCHDVRREVEG